MAAEAFHGGPDWEGKRDPSFIDVHVMSSKIRRTLSILIRLSVWLWVGFRGTSSAASKKAAKLIKEAEQPVAVAGRGSTIPWPMVNQGILS